MRYKGIQTTGSKERPFSGSGDVPGPIEQDASWRERALNGEDQIRTLRRELTIQRRLVADLKSQLRQPDGT